MQPTRLLDIRDQIDDHLRTGIIPFWTARAVDPEHGGFRTAFDRRGESDLAFPDKYIVTQTRMIWAFSRFADLDADPAIRGPRLAAASQGVDFLVAHLWDRVHGGWHWRVGRNGALVDGAKLTYGQSFAIHALAQHFRSSGDERSLQYAVDTFDLLERHVADGERGGWFENLGADWSRAGHGSAAGDRKSLDVHMHLLEAFTELALATGAPTHHRRLRDVCDLVVDRMVDLDVGTGGNQFDLAFRPLPPIVIDRTWIAERPGAAVENAAESTDATTDTISYGHDLELAWLLARADEVLGEGRDAHRDVIEALGCHARTHGFDEVHGGVYREGSRTGGATDTDKEFWQNAEALPGWLELYEQTGDPNFFDAFARTWQFARQHLVHPDLGEWYVRCRRSGEVVVGELGNPWKGAYHTGRACLEAIGRLERLAGPAATPTSRTSD